MTPHIVTLILAAGASRRMGYPKQLLTFGNTTLLGHSINEALQSGTEQVFVVLGAHRENIEKTLKDRRVTLVENMQWEAGLGSSIACGVSYILKRCEKADAILIMLADQPQVDCHYLNSLIKAFRNYPAHIIATSYGKKGGVPAVFGKDYFKALSVLKKDHGAKYLMETYAKHVIMVHPEYPLVDIDTMEDYKKFS